MEIFNVYLILIKLVTINLRIKFLVKIYLKLTEKIINFVIIIYVHFYLYI